MCRPRRIPARGVYWLPNVFTTGTLFGGFYAIVAAINGNFSRAGIAIFVAMLFDGLDGRVARWTNTQSDFGKEYDSLCDMVAFGVAPAIVAYQWGIERIADYGKFWDALRLARGVLLRGRRGAAPGALQCARGERRQALLRRTAEPVGGGGCRELHLARRASSIWHRPAGARRSRSASRSSSAR